MGKKKGKQKRLSRKEKIELACMVIVAAMSVAQVLIQILK